MKTETKELEKCQVQLTVRLDADEMKAIVKDVEKVFLREAQMPGFRKGKIPLDIIRREFSTGLKQEIERAMFQKKYADAVKEAGLEEVGLADVKDMLHDDNGGTFTAIVEVKPKFKVPTYKGLKVSSKETKVEEEAVSAQVEQMRAGCAKFEDAKDGEAVAAGDYVQIDYAGTVDGKPILEIAPDAKIVASGTGFWVQVEEGRFLPEILKALVGMKAGETKEKVKAKFDKNAAPEALKGAKAEYVLTLKAFRRRILPTDADLATQVKAESFEKMVADIRAAMEKRIVEEEAVRRENEAVDLLMKKVSFDVPGIQVRRAMDHYLNELAQRAQYSGLNAEYFEKNRDKILADAEEAATKQVRLWYVLSAIAAAEKIEAKEDELGKKVIEFVLANAKK